MEKIYNRSKFIIIFLKVIRVFIILTGIFLFLFPFYLTQLRKFNLKEDYFYFIVFPLIGLFVSIPLLIIFKKTLKEICSQYLKITDNFIESKIYNVIHNIRYDKINNINKIGKSYIISSNDDSIILGNFEKMKEIKLILKEKISLK